MDIIHECSGIFLDIRQKIKRTIPKSKFLLGVEDTDGRTVEGIINSGNNHWYKYVCRSYYMKHKTYQDLTESIRLILEKPQDLSGGMGSGIPGGAGTVVALSQQAPSAPSTQPSQSGSQPAELSQAEKLAKDRGFDYNSLPQWRKDAFQANAARKSMEGMLSGQNGSKQSRDAIKNSEQYKAQMATFKQYHTETNPIQPVERNGGGFSVGRGVGGKPVITGGSGYVSPNSAEARVRADVEAKKLPASFGDYQGNRLPMDLAKERENAGNAAFDQSINDDLGIENASKMNRNELESKAKDVVAQRTLDLDQKLRSKDYEDNGEMPNVKVGQEIKDYESKIIKNSKEIANLDREYKDASALQSFNDSLKGEQLKNQAQMDLKAQMDLRARDAFNDSLKGEEQKNQAQMDLRASAKAARAKQEKDDLENMYDWDVERNQTPPRGRGAPPRSSFQDAVKSVAQSSTPNVPQTEPVKDEDNSEARLRVTRSYNADKAAASYDAKQEMLRKRAEREAREREDAQRNTTPKIGKVNPISPY